MKKSRNSDKLFPLYKHPTDALPAPNGADFGVWGRCPVDSTGAGDVFHGAYIYAWLQGWDAKTCCRFCSGVSAIKCTRPGGRSGIPTLPVLEKFLATGEIDGAELDERVRHYKYGLLNA